MNHEENTLKTQQMYQEGVSILRQLKDEGFDSMFAGGAVRDRVMGIPPKDFDIATQASPDEVCTFFRQKGLKVVPTGIDHGTVTVVGKFGAYEITTLRQDINTDGRHAQVIFGQSFEEDAARRDFTMNAMFEDYDGNIHDYFLGRKHIQEKALHFVGDARTRIKEDFLRILRMYRFWARFDCTPSEETLEIVEELASGLALVSQERITQELLGILNGDQYDVVQEHFLVPRSWRCVCRMLKK